MEQCIVEIRHPLLKSDVPMPLSWDEYVHPLLISWGIEGAWQRQKLLLTLRERGYIRLGLNMDFMVAAREFDQMRGRLPSNERTNWFIEPF